MSWIWLADVAEEEVTGPPPLASGRWDGGHLLAWPAGRRPHPAALRADAAFLDTSGPEVDVTVQIVDPGREPLYDDPAVQELLRVLSRYHERGDGAVTTLTRDSSHWAGLIAVGHLDTGALTALGGVRYGRLAAGFASPRRQVVVGTQRNGGAPWPSPG